MEAHACEVCMTSVNESCKRKPPLQEHRLSGDFQLVTTDLISSFNGGTEKDNGVNNEDQKENKSWVCGRCTLENPGPAGACLACGGKRSFNWVCSKCTLKNPGELAKCKVCEFPRKSVQKQKGGAAAVAVAAATTAATGTSNKDRSSRAGSTKKKKCPRCTYENS